MTNQKNTKRALLMSALALLMCVSMLVGTTFAWFTDTASTSVNQINSGKLKVDLVDVDGNSLDGQILNFTDVDGNSNVLWEPGCTYSLPAVYVKNSGNLALKYVVKISGINGDAKLNEAIEWTITNAGEGVLEAGATSAAITITGHMKEDAGNEYQGLTINGIAIVVYATQANVESDMNGSDYDADAQLPSIWDGNTVTAPVADDDGVYHINNAAEFVSYINQVNSTSSNAFKIAKVVLDCDIDLNNRVIEVAGEAYAFGGQFDGQGHTVSNYVIKRTDDHPYWTALFGHISNITSNVSSVKNLNVENATVIGNGMVSAVVGAVYDGAVVENCHATNCTVIANKKVGAVVGYSNGIVNRCTAKDSDVYCEVSRDTLSNGLIQAAEVIGYDAGTSSSISSENVNVYFSTVCVFNATELKNALADPTNGGEQPARTVVIANDIDMTGWTAVNAIPNYPGVTIDGQGYTLKNLTAPLFRNVPGRNYSFSNINVDGADIALGNDGYGAAFVGEFQNNVGGTLSFVNCHVNNSKISAYKYAGAFVGYAADGGDIVITDCTVSDTTVKTVDSSCGAFIGHNRTLTTLTNCKVLGKTNVGCDEDRNGDVAKAGWLIGTIQGATTINGCTVTSTGTLTNVDSLAPIANGFVGRNVGGSLN